MSLIKVDPGYFMSKFTIALLAIVIGLDRTVCIITRHSPNRLSIVGLFRVKNNIFGYNDSHKAFISSGIIGNSGIPESNTTPHEDLILNGFPKRSRGDNPEYNKEGSILSNIWSFIKSIFSRKPTGSKPFNNRGSPNNLGRNSYSRSTVHNFPSSSFKSLPLLDLHVHNTRGHDDDYASGYIHELPKESPYSDLIHFTPSEILTLFLDKATPRVRDAVRTTVGSLVGSLYKYSVETTIITTTERLAALIYNLQMTGYMLCNADFLYVLSRHFLPDSPQSDIVQSVDSSNAGLQSKIIKASGTLQPNEEDLLSFIRQLPEDRANSLFDNLSSGVVEAMRVSTDIAIETMTAGIVNPNSYNNNNPSRMIIQQTGTSTMQLCFWQLALGYCFRDQEAKIELDNALNGKD